MHYAGLGSLTALACPDRSPRPAPGAWALGLAGLGVESGTPMP